MSLQRRAHLEYAMSAVPICLVFLSMSTHNA